MANNLNVAVVFDGFVEKLKITLNYTVNCTPFSIDKHFFFFFCTKLYKYNNTKSTKTLNYRLAFHIHCGHFDFLCVEMNRSNFKSNEKKEVERDATSATQTQAQ